MLNIQKDRTPHISAPKPRTRPSVSRTPKGETEAAGYRGLTSAEAEASRRRLGSNRLSHAPRRGFWRCFAANLNDPVIRILLAALLINLLLTLRGADWVETAGIAASVLLATTVSTVSQMGSEAAFERLRAEGTAARCRVLRDGAVCECMQDEIVVGDVVLLGAGDRVAADGELFEGELMLDQAALTGEGREVRKWTAGGLAGTPEDGRSLFRGCSVLSGQGRMVVRKVGDATVLGGISREVQEEVRESPLQIRLRRLAKQISVMGYVAALLVGVAFLFHALVIESGMRYEIVRIKLCDAPYLASTLLRALMLSLTVIVVAVPEGLPMMIAVVLSANIRRMARDHVLVRRAVGIEAAGSMDLLFTDKTGTLTEGRLSVGKILTADGEFPDVAAFCAAGRARFEQYLLFGRYGSEAVLGRQGGAEQALGGNATDRALLLSTRGHRAGAAQVVERLPFDSTRKLSAVTMLSGGQRLLLVKGAPEHLLPHLRDAVTADGGRDTLARETFCSRIRALSSLGARVLLLAVGQGSCDALARGEMPPLSLLCALTLTDAVRPTSKKAVRELREAGVQVVMITGDAPETATSIARTVGIIEKESDLVLTGEQMAGMTDGELTECLPRLAVVARALPRDKSRLVRLAQSMERVVGMTGDGINDAPALRRADIGFAMGSGAPVARDAGDVLILDDNLSSIVRAVLYGRNIFKSIRKFITLQLIMNLCAVGISMIGPFIGVSTPVTVVQMLWVNLIMDTLGGLAFAGEAASPDCMRERPKRRDEPILNRYMIHEILLLGGYTIGLCVLFLKHPAIRAAYRASEGDLCHLTAFFALFIFASVFNCFNARSDRLRVGGVWRHNRVFVWIMAAILLVQILFVYLGGTVLRTMPLTARELALTAALAASVIPAELLRKLLWRYRGARRYGKY